MSDIIKNGALFSRSLTLKDIPRDTDNIQVVLSVPTGVDILNVNIIKGTFDTPTKTWNVGTGIKGESYTLGVNFTVTDETLGPFTITATLIFPGDPNLNNNDISWVISGLTCNDIQECFNLTIPRADWAETDTNSTKFIENKPADLMGVLDEDDFASDSATQAPSQQSTKAYIDNAVSGLGDMSKNVYDTNDDGKVDSADDADTVNGLTVETAVPTGALFTDTVKTDAEIKTAYEANSNTEVFTTSEKVKLSTVESNAEANQTGAEIKVAYEAEADTNAFDDAAVAKLAAIEASAKDDQTASEVPTTITGANFITDNTDTQNALTELDTAIGNTVGFPCNLVHNFPASITTGTLTKGGAGNFSLDLNIGVGAGGTHVFDVDNVYGYCNGCDYDTAFLKPIEITFSSIVNVVAVGLTSPTGLGGLSGNQSRYQIEFDESSFGAFSFDIEFSCDGGATQFTMSVSGTTAA